MDNTDQSNPPNGVIPIKDAIALNDEWSKTRAEAMNQCISDVTGGKVTEDNRSSWWSVDDLEAYIKYAKRQARNQKKEVSGFRMYCGAYAEGDCYATSFLVPTTTVQGSLGKDGADEDNDDDLPIDPLNVGEKGNPPGNGYTGG